MGCSITKQFPLIWVDLATLLTVSPLLFLFYVESLTNTVHLTWKVQIMGPSLNISELMSERDYRSEMFKDENHIGTFFAWFFDF